MLASCWVARKIFLSAASAASRARTLDSRPTTNGVIIKGKMTTSRMGIIGSFLLSNFSLAVVTRAPNPTGASHFINLPLPGFFHHGQGSVTLLHHFSGYFKLLHLFLAGEVVHQVEHQLFEDHTQAARANFARHGLTCNRLECVIAELQAY